MNRSSPSGVSDSIAVYLSEIRHHPVLAAEEEQALARAYRLTGDPAYAHRLVTANLRFVVKIAQEYRSYGVKTADLIQEGNIGLMKAVQRFDADKNVRLLSYAVWWIRACIQDHVLKSFSLVKLGTTQAQRKLFFSLARTKRDLDHASVGHGLDSDGEDPLQLARKLDVKPCEVLEMTQRLSRDVSLDAPVGVESGLSLVDSLADARVANDDVLSAAEQRELLRGGVAAAVALLDPRERFIIERRAMSEPPMPLLDVAEHFGISRERARQLEVRAMRKLRESLRELASDLNWPTGKSKRRAAA